jgi:hypothetical protein
MCMHHAPPLSVKSVGKVNLFSSNVETTYKVPGFHFSFPFFSRVNQTFICGNFYSRKVVFNFFTFYFNTGILPKITFFGSGMSVGIQYIPQRFFLRKFLSVLYKVYIKLASFFKLHK